jgi:hypothetical protein
MMFNVRWSLSSGGCILKLRRHIVQHIGFEVVTLGKSPLLLHRLTLNRSSLHSEQKRNDDCIVRTCTIVPRVA